MKIIPIVIGLLISYSYLLAQDPCLLKHDRVWIMGDQDNDTITNEYGGCKIIFTSDTFYTSVHPKTADMPFQNNTMSSDSGELLFFSNGCSIYDKEGNIMKDGGNLNPGELYPFNCPEYGYVGFQNMLSIPDPYNKDHYYLFYISQILNHEPNVPFIIQNENLYYALIDMKGDSGLGTVIAKNAVVFIDTNMIGCPLTATRHGNGIDWWLITPDRWRPDFNIVLLNENGPNYLGKQTIGIPPNPYSEGGQGKFSPDGAIFAWFHPKNGLYLYDFDRTSGNLSNFNLITIPVTDFAAGGCEFSPSGQYVYVNNNLSLYQVDVKSDDIQASVVHISNYDGFGDPLPTRFFYMERSPDKRIIMNCTNGSQYLHTILFPDKKGIDCGFRQHHIKLPTVNNFTIPHFPNYRLGAIDEPLCDSLVNSIPTPNNTFNWTLYPNPAKDQITIKLKSDHSLLEDIDYSIFNNIGGLQFTDHISAFDTEHHVNIETLQPGIYYIQLKSSSTSHTRKIIVSD